MRRIKFLIAGMLALGLMTSLECMANEGDAATSSGVGVRSIYTGLDTQSCETKLDKDSADDATYRLCPGMGGYKIAIFQNDVRQNVIYLVDQKLFDADHPDAQKAAMFRLDFGKPIRGHDFEVYGRAEWRVMQQDMKQTPIAVLIQVAERGGVKGNPSKISLKYYIIAKITPDAVCATARIQWRELSPKLLRQLADSSRDKTCF